MKIVLVDTGCGNTGSVVIAFERLGLKPVLTTDIPEILSADRVIIPGVGSAGEAMKQIDQHGLGDTLRQLTQPVLGICLGMQLMFDRSEEDDVDCLGIIAGQVRKLEPAPDRPVPNMGWSKLAVKDESIALKDGEYVWFANSFACDDGPHSVATISYGRPIPAVVRKDNYLGAQFHPERSGEPGTRFLEAFLS